MALYRDKNSPYWWASYSLPSGKRVRESTKQTNKKEAMNFLAARLTSAREPSKQNVAKLLDSLLSDYETNGKSIAWARIVVDVHLRPAFGALKAEALTKEAVKDYIAMRKKLGRANATVNREVSLLRRAFTLAEIPFPKIEKLAENNVRKGFLTDEQFFLLLSHSPTHIKPILMYAYKTGSRLKEILNLRWNQVDLEHSVIRLNPGETKNKDGRVIPLDSQLVRMFRGMLPGDSEYVFTYRNQRIRSIKTAFASAVKAAKLDGLLFHDLRRCGVRNLSRAGVPESVIMAISGHRTRSIFDRYNIVSERDLLEAMKKREQSLTRFERDAEAFVANGLSTLK